MTWAAIKRRTFIALLGGMTLVLPLAAHAQPSAMPTVCGSIGVQVRPMTRAFAESLGMTEPHGAIFDRPKPGSPAARAGIEASDVVTAINGAPLMNWRDFATTIAKFAPGTRIYLNIRRNRQFIEIPATLGSAACPAAPKAGPAGSAT